MSIELQIVAVGDFKGEASIVAQICEDLNTTFILDATKFMSIEFHIVTVGDLEGEASNVAHIWGHPNTTLILDIPKWKLHFFFLICLVLFPIVLRIFDSTMEYLPFYLHQLGANQNYKWRNFNLSIPLKTIEHPNVHLNM